ncbi:MAG: hypothetical protein ACI9MR_001096 [Myxococcota bacterium]|jgi:hypothetical protein
MESGSHDPVAMSLWLVVAGACLCLLLGLVLGVVAARREPRVRMQRHRRQGAAGEPRGLALLKRAGYTLIETQPSALVSVSLDGHRHECGVRADALVTRDGRRWIAEIKSGPETAKITHRATRRQLLEYAYAFECDGILLVSVPERRVQEVRFL